MQDRLYRDPDLTRFYDIENDGGPDFGFCRVLAQSAGSVLDLGCGTGGFLAALDGDKRRVGADPAAAMLAIAATRPGGDGVTWVEADARTLRLEERFDLIVLTGHAYQVFLDDDDQRAVLATIAAHLAPDGRFVFDSRNPDDADWRDWTPDKSLRVIEDPELGPVEAWNDVAYDAQRSVVTYETHYRVERTGNRIHAHSDIRFTPKDTIAELIEEAGLAVETWLGDWPGTPWTPEAPEIIPIVRLR